MELLHNEFMDKVKEILPEGGNLNLCLTCGACSSGCPATGLDGMDPRKFLRMAALGLDEEIAKSNWPWMCTMCQRCIYVCPMQIDIPQLVYNARALRPREERPKGILGSCDMALRNESTSAMGTSPDDFVFVVEDVLEEYQEAQPEFADMQAPIDKEGAEFFLNQNSGNRSPNRMNWSRCGKSCILPGWTGLTAARDGGGKLLHVPGRRRLPGSMVTQRPSTRPTNWGEDVSQHRVRARHFLSPGRTEKIQPRAQF
jgi:ferredoxin